MQARAILSKALEDALLRLNFQLPQKLVIETPKQEKFGDLSTNVAMLLASAARKSPRELATQIAAILAEDTNTILKADVAGPGFINITFAPALWRAIINDVEDKQGAFGHSDNGKGRKVLVEYVSANPTGPLHVGHGRGAALGDSVARMLRAAGYAVETEYYLNDAGRQMRNLGLSIWLRAREISGETINFPDDCYQGQYIKDLASQLLHTEPHLLDMPEEDGKKLCQKFGTEEILRDIREDMQEFRCEHQRFASEAALMRSGAVENALGKLADDGKSYNRDGALWLKTTEYGDDHDRVLRKSDGLLTYFGTDIAYHDDKFQRGFDWLIDVWGADHHGYIPRMRAAIAEMGHDPEKFSVLLVQLVNLLRDGTVVAMSTRSGEFVTLKEVIDEVGTDAARFMFLSRSYESPLDFDLELAKKRTLDNPVYYVQYAHARICSLLRRATDKGVVLDNKTPLDVLERLNTQEELALMRQMAQYEDIVAGAAQRLAPHHISRFLLDFAALVHGYYAKQHILDEADIPATTARLALLRAAAHVIRNGLFLLGVNAPDAM